MSTMISRADAYQLIREMVNQLEEEDEGKKLDQIAVPSFLIENINDPVGIKNVNFSNDCVLDKNDERYEGWKNDRLERGFDDTELWNLDHTILRFIQPRLKAFAKGAPMRGYPGNLNNQEEWLHILDEMIFAVDWYLDEDREEFVPDGQCGYKHDENNNLILSEDHKRAKEGWKLFCENIFGLWD